MTMRRLSFIVFLVGFGCSDVSSVDVPDAADATLWDAELPRLDDLGDATLDVKPEAKPEELVQDELGLVDVPCAGYSMELDSDGDGVDDYQECLDETDPSDPSDASVWHPEMVDVHPRLFVTAEELPALKERLETPLPDDEVLWSRITARCDADLPEHPDGEFDIFVSQSRAHIAVSCIFEGWVTGDAALIRRGAEIMAAPFPDPSYLGEGLLVPVDEYNLLESEALMLYCTGWDFLANAVGVDESLVADARNRLVERIDTYRELMHKDAFYLMNLATQNNHGMKMFGAMGLCAMALNDRREAASDLSDAYAGLTYLFTQYQSLPGGGYAEGWNYLNYGGESFLPFLAAHRRFSGGEDRLYRGSGVLTDGDPLAGEAVEYQDLVENQRAIDVYRLALESTFPDGLTVNTDDANRTPLHGALLGAIFSSPDFVWNWRKEAVGRYAGLLDIATFCLHDPELEPETPNWSLAKFPYGSGLAYGRTSMDEDAIFFQVQAEFGHANSHGGGHEHPEPGSFLIYAFGEYLALDPGYINFEHHQLVMYGHDHNLVLADGEGPEMWMDSLSLTEGLFHDVSLGQWPRRTEVETAYADTQFYRYFFQVTPTLFLVADKMVSQNPRTYTWQLNGHAGGESGGSFQMLDNGAVWQRSLAGMKATVVPVTGEGVYEHHLEEHAIGHGHWATHEMLTVSAEMDTGAGFLAVIEVAPQGTALSAVSLVYQEAGVTVLEVALQEGTAFVVFNRNEEPTTIPAFQDPESTWTVSSGVGWHPPI